MELSTSMPTPRARPPRDMMFRLTPVAYMRKKVAATEIGIDRLMMAVLLRWRRKRKRMTIASRPPMTAVFRTSSTDWEMNRAWSTTISTSASPSRSPKRDWNSPRRSRTAAETLTVFASPSLKTAISTPSRPSMRVTTSRSSWPRTTRPTSASFTGAPSTRAMTIRSMSAGPVSSFRVRTRNSASPSFSRPPVRFTFSAARRWVTRLTGMPRLARRRVSSSTWISSSRPPSTRTAATPSRLSRSSRTRSSATRRSSMRLLPPWRAMRMIGSREGSKRSRIGLSASSGRSTRSSFSLRSREAKSMSVPHSNSTMTSDSPGRETELTRTTRLTTPTSPSIGSEISRSISAGAVPGYSVRMVIVG